MLLWLLIALTVGACFLFCRERAARIAFNHLQQVTFDALQGAPVGVLYCDPADHVVFWNEQYAEFLGPTRERLRRGMSFCDLVQDVGKRGWVSQQEGSPQDWLDGRAAASTTGSGTRELRLADGRWLRFEDRRTAAGGLMLIVSEVTAGKRRERVFQNTFNNNPVAMCIWDRDTLEVTQVNAAARRHYGWPAEQLQHLRMDDLLADEEKQALRDELSKESDREYGGERPWRHVRADGSEMMVLPHVAGLYSSDRRLLLSTLVDITHQIETETELRAQKSALAEATARAEAANQAKSEFLANMSHEIRTPLNGVVAVADVLSRTPMAPDQAEMVELIRSSGDTLHRLLSDVLDLARVEAGRLTIEEQPFDLGQALRDVVGLAAMKAQEKGVAFDAEIAPTVTHLVRGDVVRLKQIVTNLLSNAVKFTDEGAVRLEATLGDEEDLIVIRVHDTGAGFDEAVKDKLFNRFQQADGSITRKFGGSGLGLAICRELVSLMDGQIDCESRPDVGSTFTVSLRLPPCENPRQQDFQVASGCDRQLRVLLADDHPTNQRVACMVLSQIDADVTVVGDGEQALQAFGSGNYDLVLMDMHMPVRDGLSATAAIRVAEAAFIRRRTPVVMLTANASADHVASSLAAGADMHLSKPYTAEELLSVVFAMVEEHEAVAEVA